MKIINRPMKVGQWKVQLASPQLAGHVVEAIFLKGNRNRPWPLTKVSEEEFRKRFPIDQGDEPVLRGIPSMWMMRGPVLHVWPSPAHEWTLELRLVEREKGHDLAAEADARSAGAVAVRLDHP